MPPRKRKAVAAPQPCPACDGTGETPQPLTRRRGTVRGQMGVCLACLGTGHADTAPAPAPVGQLHP
jgi:DnaJ-class molecular chaperone